MLVEKVEKGQGVKATLHQNLQLFQKVSINLHQWLVHLVAI